MSLSVIIPCFNEQNSICLIVEKVNRALSEHNIDYEVIIVDDGSTDDSVCNLLQSNFSYNLIQQENRGKGAAVQTGIKSATKNFILVQDADLEYEPSDIYKLYSSRGENIAVYGSRFLNKNNKFSFPKNYSFTSKVASFIFTFMHLVLYRKFITDTLTGYKLYPRNFFINNEIKTNGFETDHEITALLIKSNYKIIEKCIMYYPRSKSEGKKIGFNDFVIAFFLIIKLRILL